MLPAGRVEAILYCVEQGHIPDLTELAELDGNGDGTSSSEAKFPPDTYYCRRCHASFTVSESAYIREPVTNMCELPDDIKAILKFGGISLIGELIQKPEKDLANIPGLVPEMIDKIKWALRRIGLALDTELENWPPRQLK